MGSQDSVMLLLVASAFGGSGHLNVSHLDPNLLKRGNEFDCRHQHCQIPSVVSVVLSLRAVKVRGLGI